MCTFFMKLYAKPLFIYLNGGFLLGEYQKLVQLLFPASSTFSLPGLSQSRKGLKTPSGGGKLGETTE